MQYLLPADAENQGRGMTLRLQRALEIYADKENVEFLNMKAALAAAGFSPSHISRMVRSKTTRRQFAEQAAVAQQSAAGTGIKVLLELAEIGSEEQIRLGAAKSLAALQPKYDFDDGLAIADEEDFEQLSHMELLRIARGAHQDEVAEQATQVQQAADGEFSSL